MNYIYHYDRLINRAKQRELNKEIYTEQHHIIPKCMGGDDSVENLVKLTPEEHYTAHLLLIKIYPNQHSLYYAAVMMCATNNFHSNGSGRSNKIYGWLKRKYVAICKQRVGEKNGSYGTRWVTNGVEAKKIKKTDIIPEGYVKGRVIKPIKKSKKDKKISEDIALSMLNDYESGMAMTDILVKYNRKTEQSVTTFLRKRFPNRKTFLPKKRTMSPKH